MPLVPFAVVNIDGVRLSIGFAPSALSKDIVGVLVGCQRIYVMLLPENKLSPTSDTKCTKDVCNACSNLHTRDMDNSYLDCRDMRLAICSQPSSSSSPEPYAMNRVKRERRNAVKFDRALKRRARSVCGCMPRASMLQSADLVHPMKFISTASQTTPVIINAD